MQPLRDIVQFDPAGGNARGRGAGIAGVGGATAAGTGEMQVKCVSGAARIPDAKLGHEGYQPWRYRKMTG